MCVGTPLRGVCRGDERESESVRASLVKLHLSLDVGQFVGIDDFVKVGDLFFCHLAGDNCQQGLFAPDQYPCCPVDHG